MSEQQQLLLKETTNMSESELKEVVLFAQYIKFRKKNIDIPERLLDKDEKDLEEKLEMSLKESEDGNVYSFEEVFNSSNDLLNN